jgi:hypothetical protein
MNKKEKKHIHFSPVTHVTNLYNTFENDKLVSRNADEYNVSTNEDEYMPGYPLSNPKFEPHSKSSLQRAFTIKSKYKNFNMGWQGAITYNDDNNYTISNKRAALINRNIMKSIYGNAWINAEVTKDMANKESQLLKKKALEEYNKAIIELENNFLNTTGFPAPTVLEREMDKKIKDLHKNKNINNFSFLIERRKLYKEKVDLLLEIPTHYKSSFQKNIDNLDKELYEKYLEAENIEKNIMRTAFIGKAYAPKKKLTLKNRLNNAKRIKNAEKFKSKSK